MIALLALIIAMAAAAPNKQLDPLWTDEPTYGEWVEVEQVDVKEPAVAVERQPALTTNWWDWVTQFLLTYSKQDSSMLKQQLEIFAMH